MFLRMKRPRSKEKGSNALVAQEISNAYRINEVLSLILNNHATLEARVAGDSNCYSTSILDLFPNQHRIALDELSSNEGHSNFLLSKELKLSCSLDGMVINFQTELKEKGEADGITFYRVLFPTKLSYLQRRQHPRVSVPGSADFQAHHEKNQQRFNGYVHDISASGIAVFLDGIHTIKEGERLTQCTAQLPIIGSIVFDMEACYVFQDPMRNIIKVGGSFIDMDSETLSKLETLIKQLQNS